MNKAPKVDEAEAFAANKACRRGIRDVAQAVFVFSGSHLGIDTYVKRTGFTCAVLPIFPFADRSVRCQKTDAPTKGTSTPKQSSLWQRGINHRLFACQKG